MTKEEALDRAFCTVFGTNDNGRSPEQRIVLARLRQLARPQAHHWAAGQDPGALPFAQGRLRMWLEIDNRISDKPETLDELLGLEAEDTGATDHDD